MGAANEEARGEPAKPRIPQTGEILADKYRVERVVGVGGMGVVLAAQHLQLGQLVAIKLLSTEETRRTEAIARFQREGRAAAGLRSDHVVRIYDVGTLADGSPFMVMELLRGTDLATLLDERGPLPVPHAVEFILQACDAIGEAHTLGIVHRDLKPSNLFVTRRSDGIALLKVLDFGISKAIHPEAEGIEGNLTQTRSVMGSPYYMSPEQVRDAKKVDARTDIWALGVILHELLTATPAFQADTFPGICAAIVADDPADIRSLRPDVPPELVAVIDRCLQKDPRLRFQHVSELVSALTLFAPHGVSTMPTLPAPPGSLPRAAPSVSTEAATISLPAEPRPQLSSSARIVIAESGPAPASFAATEAEVSASRPARPSFRPGRTKFGLLLAGAFALGIAAAIALALGRSERATTPPGEATRATFRLTIESTPPGAEVLETGRTLGTTPLGFAIDRASVENGPRNFILKRPGFLPYSLRQGSSNEDVRVLAALVPEPAVAVEPAPPASASAVPASPEPASRAPSRPVRAAAKPPASKPPASKPPASAAPPAPSLDIRMQR